MTSRLGVYWSVMHRRPQDYAYFKSLNPSVIKVMDGGASDYEWIKSNLPDSLVIARDWALSEQHSDMLANPAETGMRHAREWDEHQPRLGFDKAKTLILGINEPAVWQSGFTEALRIYTISLCDEAKRRGLRVGAMQLGVGWPNNNGPDTPPDWGPWHGVEQAILSNGGALITHEYWADNGPSENWGWWGGRTLKCPWQVPIVSGECGVDMFVKDVSVGQQNRGWLGHMPPERYASELAEYVGRMSADTRFVGCCVFASDFAAHEWFSFDVEPAYKAILAMKIPDNKPPTPPTTTTMYVAVPSGARIRSAPVIRTDNILGAVAYGEPVIVTNYTADHSWAEVGYKDIRGWMSSALLSSAKPPLIPTTPPVPAPIPPTPTPTNGALDPLMLEAIVMTESGGNGFENSKLKIRMEAHLLLGASWGNPAAFKPYFRYDAGNVLLAYYRRSASEPWVMYHLNQNTEWGAFDFARKLDSSAALRCTSMGAGQIMGFNAQRIGYATPELMFDAFSTDEIPQTIGVVNYCLSDPALVQAIRDKDFSEITTRYNGVGLEAIYTPRLMANYQRLGGVI